MNVADTGSLAMDPELRSALEAMQAGPFAMSFPSTDLVPWIAERRAAAAGLATRRPRDMRGVTSRDVSVDTLDGSPSVTVRVYTPPSVELPGPGVLWMYGGAFIFGGLDENDDLCAAIASSLGGVVVAAHYRKAPEDPYPAALNDCYRALTWTAEHAAELGIDPTRLGVGGASAGANFAVALTLLSRDRGGPALAFQMPLFAALDDRTVTPSSRSILDPQIVNSPHYAEIWKLYLGPLAGGEVPPYAAPARMKDLTRLPPAYVYVGQLDPMRDENIEYATRLMQAGVPVELHVFPGAYHGFARMAPLAAVSQRALGECLDALRRGLAARVVRA